jgi:large subunit ribosomal protein L47
MRDLHTLWYVVLRERNLLATQKEEARRMGIQNTSALAVPAKLAHVRPSPRPVLEACS